MKRKTTTLLTALAATALATGSTHAAPITFDLAGLQNPTGAATNGGDTRQFAYTTSGGEITITYTLDIDMASPTSLDNPYQFDTLFRRPGSGAQLPGTGGNMVAGESLKITIDSVVANAGWVLNSLTKSNTVGVAGDSRNGSEQATFTVNGGAAFTLGPIASSGAQTLTDNRFTDFDSAGDSLLFETTAGNAGKLNLRNLTFTADVEVVPEPGSLALMALGGVLVIRRRRSC